MSGHISIRNGLGNVVMDYADEQVNTGCDRWQKIKIRLQKGYREFRNTKVLIVLKGPKKIIEYPLNELQLSQIEHQPLGISAFSSKRGDYRVANIKQSLLRIDPPANEYAQRNYASYHYLIPNRAEELFVLSHDNQATSDKVVLVVQGGPLSFLVQGLPESRSVYDNQLLFPSFYSFIDEGFSIVNVHQINTLYSEFSKAQYNFTPEDITYLQTRNQKIQEILGSIDNVQTQEEYLELIQRLEASSQEIEQYIIQREEEEKQEVEKYLPSLVGREVALQNAEILVRVIRYFQSQNKKVYLWGASYGALLTQFMLINYPDIINSVEKVTLAVGRLQFSSETLDALRMENDLNLVFNDNTQQVDVMFSERTADSTFFSRMLYAVSRPDYIAEFSGLNFPKNKICYMVADRDLNIGNLSLTEENFAKTAFQFTKLTMGGRPEEMMGAPHSAYFYEEAINVVLDFYLEREGTQCNRGKVIVQEPSWEGWEESLIPPF